MRFLIRSRLQHADLKCAIKSLGTLSRNYNLRDCEEQQDRHDSCLSATPLTEAVRLLTDLALTPALAANGCLGWDDRSLCLKNM